MSLCSGYGQDRASFHQKPGRDTARLAESNWTNKTGWSIPSAIMLGSGEGELAGEGGNRGLGARGHQAVRVVLCISLFCIFFLLELRSLLFTSFAVLLDCPYPSPRVFAIFFPFSSPPDWGEG